MEGRSWEWQILEEPAANTQPAKNFFYNSLQVKTGRCAKKCKS